MTTAKEVKTLVAPILAKYPDFGLIGRLVFMKPVRHVIRGIFIEKTSLREWFRVHAVIDMQLGKTNGFSIYNLPRQFHGKTPWNHELPGIDIAVLEVFERLLPQIRGVSTLDDFETFIVNSKTHPDFVTGSKGGNEAILLRLALGKLDQACAIAEEFTNVMRARFERLDPYERNELNQAEELHAMILRGDRKEMAKHLHAMEHRNVDGLKIAKFYEPTPFPLELM